MFVFFLVRLMQNCDDVTVKVSAHRKRQLMREIKHTGKYEYCESFHFIVVIMYSGARCISNIRTLAGK